MNDWHAAHLGNVGAVSCWSRALSRGCVAHLESKWWKKLYTKKEKIHSCTIYDLYIVKHTIFSLYFHITKRKEIIHIHIYFFFSVWCFFIFCLHNNKNNKNKQRKKGSHQQNQESSFQLLRRETHTWLLMEMCKAPPMSKWGTFDKARVSCMTPCPDRAASPWTFIHRGERILGK